MYDMASAAISLGNRAVSKFLAFKLLSESRQDLIIAYFLGFVMTRNAETHSILFQQEFDTRSMWSMTVHTTVNISYNAVLVQGVFRDIPSVLMTSVAKVGREAFNHL